MAPMPHLRSKRGSPLLRNTLLLAAAALSSACGSAPSASTGSAAPAAGPATSAAPPPAAAALPGAAPAAEQARATARERPAAIWNGTAVEWTDIRPLLAERSGAVVLEEYLLDRQVEMLLRERGITLEQTQVAAEEALLLETLDRNPERARVLLVELRNTQGLGPERWSRLLRRNAGLRAVVQPEVRISQDAVSAAVDAAHGPKRRCRIMVVPDLRVAESAAARLAAGESFADVAVELSTDRSAERGGLIPPVSRMDPSFPSSLRKALWELPQGGTSSPVLLESGVAIIRFERELPGDGTSPESARAEGELAVRRAQERLLMENTARAMLRDAASVTIFDDALLDSWKRARGTQVRR